MQQTSSHFLDDANTALQDSEQQATRDFLGIVQPELTRQAREDFSAWESLRHHVRQVRDHSLDNLAHYLESFESNALDNGAKVHWVESTEALNQTVLGICRDAGARRIAKGKSMVTEETGLNEYLIRAGLEVTETDLGEYIIQQAGETPSHIVGPALHKSVDEVRELFLDKHELGPRELAGPPEMVMEARKVLRQHFLNAEVGIIGANALVAETGYSMLITNEGNGDLVSTLPPIQIVCTTIDRVLPTSEDATAMLRLLARSATGQPVTCYTSFYSGPRRDGDEDGPMQTHFILLDNQRTDILASDYRDMLRCIRCGNCLPHCPVYVAAGGHAYGWVYPGPVGSVLTPLLTGLEQSHQLPNACTGCGRCAEVCPSEIPLPDLLRDLRHEENRRKLNDTGWRRSLALHAYLLRWPRLYQMLAGLVVPILHRFGKKSGVLRKLPLAEGWTRQRDFPAPQKTTFMQAWRKHQKRAGND